VLIAASKRWAWRWTMPSQAKQGALRVGEDLAVSSGAVRYYRDAACEVIRSVVAY